MHQTKIGALRAAVAAAVPLLLLPLAAGCHDHSEALGVDEFIYDCENAPAGSTGFATDESYMAMVNREFAMTLVTDDARAATVTDPLPGSALSAASPPTITLRVPQAALTPGGGAPGRCPPRRSRWARLWDLISFEGTAYAHCPAVSGVNYLFRFEDPESKAAIYTAVLSVTSFTPNAAKWSAKLAGRQGQPIQLTLMRAVFTAGTITDGPFVATTKTTYTVGP